MKTEEYIQSSSDAESSCTRMPLEERILHRFCAKTSGEVQQVSENKPLVVDQSVEESTAYQCPVCYS
jgi:hypothetical protein